jgi:hypothetical protein
MAAECFSTSTPQNVIMPARPEPAVGVFTFSWKDERHEIEVEEHHVHRRVLQHGETTLRESISSAHAHAEALFKKKERLRDGHGAMAEYEALSGRYKRRPPGSGRYASRAMLPPSRARHQENGRAGTTTNAALNGPLKTDPEVPWFQLGTVRHPRLAFAGPCYKSIQFGWGRARTADGSNGVFLSKQGR